MIMTDNSKFELIRQNYSNLDKQNVWRNPGSLLLLLFNTFKSTFKHFIFATIYKANRIVIVCSEVVFIVSTNHERLIAFCEYLEWQIIVCVQTFNTNDDNGKGIDPAITNIFWNNSEIYLYTYRACLIHFVVWALWLHVQFLTNQGCSNQCRNILYRIGLSRYTRLTLQ